MNLNNISPGKDIPYSFNTIIEISMNSDPIKYEVDKETGILKVDRFMPTAMHYPCNYGYVPKTLAGDGDPIDVLVITPFPLQIGVVVCVRPIGMLSMEDESGNDIKLLSLPTDKLYYPYRNIQSYTDLPSDNLRQIEHFFEHYKDLEPNKWVKVKGWKNVEEAHQEILCSVSRYSGEQT